MTYWNAKPRAAQAADARYVLKWLPGLAETILNYGYPHMVDAIARANTIEQAAQKAADDLGVDVEVVRVWIQLTDDERATLRAEWKQKHRTKGHKREMKVR